MRIPRPRLLSTRLALAAAIGVAIAVVAFAVTGYVLIKHGAYDEIDRSLEVTADEASIAASKSDAGTPDFAAPPTARTGGRVAPAPRQAAPASTVIQKTEGGKPLGPARIAGTTIPAQALPVLPPGPPQTVQIRGENFRVVVKEMAKSPDGRPRTVMVARPIQDVETTLSEAATRLALGAAAASVLALFIALYATRRGLRRLVRVRDAAERVAVSQDLTVRIDEGRPDEVGDLASSMNRMLTRLEASQERLAEALQEQRRFAADASHELRTPLTAIRGDIDLLQRHELPPDERAQVLDEMGQAAARMERMVADLLVLARSEGGGTGRADEVDLVELVTGLVQSGEQLDLPPAGTRPIVLADPAALDGLFRNLLENARRHGDTVRLALRTEAGMAVVEVADDGPGVSPEDRERIFDRFYRAPSLRNTPGTGLGLAIARMAAEQAGGSVALLDSAVGARFEVRLPVSATRTGPRPVPTSV